MLEKNEKMNINKCVILTLVFFCLIFISIGFNNENSYAVDLNESNDNVSVQIDMEDELESSSIIEDDLKVSNVTEEVVQASGDVNESLYMVDSGDPEVLGYWSILGGYFSGITSALVNFGDGEYFCFENDGHYREGDDTFQFYRPFHMSSTMYTDLDALHQMALVKLNPGAEGTILSNFKFTNGEGVTGSAIEICCSNVLIENCTFRYNHCEYGGIISIAEDVTNVTIRNCIFLNNSAYSEDFQNDGFGGAIGIYGKNCTIENCIFDSNWVCGSYSGYGGAIDVGYNIEDINIKNCTFMGNYALNLNAESYGGAMSIRKGVNVSDCIFINNTADFGGAVIFFDDYTINNCSFINNTANQNGGALYSDYYTTINLNNLTFYGNKAINGGAIYTNSENLNISDCIFENNHANYGGAINIATKNVGISDSIFISNYAEMDGGAIYINSSDILIQSCNFTSNKAINGSGIYIDKNSHGVSLNNNEFHNNQAQAFELALFAEDTFYEFTEHINITVIGGNNIVNRNNLLISNAIYNAAPISELEIDGRTVCEGASLTGIYRDDLAYNTAILLTLTHEDGTVEYNNTFYTNYLGQIFVEINYLRPGKYNVTAKTLEDTYYINIENSTILYLFAEIDNSINITSNTTEYNYADIVNWTVTISNFGFNEASEINVNVLLPEGLIYLGDNTNGLYNATTGELNLSKLEVSETFVFNITTLINNTVDFTVKSNVSATEFDTNLTNNNVEFNFLVNHSSDLEINLISNESNFNYHDLVNWTITVKNNGPNIAQDIEIHDVITNDLIPIDFSGDFNLTSTSWIINSLDIGEEIQLNLITKINTTGVIVNNVWVNGSEYDFNKSNNKINSSINVYSTGDLSVNVDVNASNVNYLDYVKWTLTITNNGLDNVNNVSVVNILPEGFTYINSTLDYVDNTFYIGNLSVGEVVIIDIYCKVDTTGNFYNYANITGYEFDFDLDNNEYACEIIVNASSELDIKESVCDINPNFNDLINWTVTIQNNGPDIANNITVSDLISKSLLYISDDSDNKYDPLLGKWKIDTLDVGSNLTLTITCRVINSGIILNAVNITSNEYDYYLDNNCDLLSILVNDSSDLVITVDVNASNLNYNDVVKLTVTVKNMGVDEATDIKILNTIPEGFTYLDSIITYSNGQIYLDKLAVNETTTFDLYLKANKSGNYINNMYVFSNEYDYNQENNYAENSIYINPTADLEVKSNFNVSHSKIGDYVDLTITVKNNGFNHAEDIIIVNNASKSLIYINDTSDGEYNNLTNQWNINYLDIAEIRSLTISYKLNNTGTIVNSINVTSQVFDYNLNNNYNSTSINVNASCDLSIITSVNATNINHGDLIKLTINVSNNAYDDATNVKINNMIPKGFIIVDSTLFEFKRISKGDNYVFYIYLKANSTGCFNISSSIESFEEDINLNNNNNSVFVNVGSICDLEITQSILNPKYLDYVNFTVTVKNNGVDVANDVIVNALVPEGLSYVSCDLSDSYDPLSGLWNVGDIASGDEYCLNILCKVINTGEIKSDVTVSSQTFDYNLVNNNNSISINIPESCDLVIKAEVNASNVDYNNNVKLTITVENKGFNTAYNVKITNTLPEGFVYVDSFLNYMDGEISIDKLLPNEEKSFEITIKAGAIGEFENNVSVISSVDDLNITNNNGVYYINVNSASDLEVSGFFNTSNANYGDYVALTITVKNNGLNTTSAVVRNIMSKSLICINTTSLSDYVGGIWYINNILSGESTSLTITYEVNDTGSIINTLSIESDNFDYNLDNNNASNILVVGDASDLTIVGSVNCSDVNYHDLVKLIWSITNNGLNDARDVNVNVDAPMGFICIDSDLNSVSLLRVGETKVFDVIYMVNTTGSYSISANVSSCNFDYNLSNNIDLIDINVNQSADLEVNQSILNPKYLDYVNFTVTVKNNGVDVANDVIVNALVPEGLSYVSCDLSDSYDPVFGLWNVGDIASGDEYCLNILCEVVNTGEIKSDVTVSSQTFDYNLVNNNNSISLNISQSCDLVIKAEVNASNVNYHDSVKLTIYVENKGFNTAYNVKIINTLPQGLIYIDSILNSTDGVFFAEKLSPNEKISFDVILKAEDIGEFENRVYVVSSIDDLNITNNDDVCYIKVNSASDLEVSGFFNTSNANYGDFVTLTITVKNNGLNTTSAVVRNIMSKSLICINTTSLSDYVDGIWYINNILSGESTSLTITYEVNNTGSIINTLNIESDNFDYNLDNNNASNILVVGDTSDLSIVGSVNCSDVNYHDLVKLTLSITNNGLNDAYDVNVYVNAPLGFICIDSDLNSVSLLRVGETKVFDVIYMVNTTGSYSISANVSSNNTDYNLSNNIDLIDINVNQSADLEITCSINNTNPNYNDLINWKVSVKNNGINPARNVVVKAEIPNSLILLSNNECYWNIPLLNVGESIDFEINAKVNNSGNINCKVNVSSDNFDYDLSNNEALKVLNVNSTTDLSIKTSVNVSNVNYQDYINLTLIITNNGLDDADGVIVENILPEEFILIKSSLNYNNGIINIGNLEKGMEMPINIIFKVNNTGNYSILSNISSHNFDFNLENNNDSLIINVNKTCDLSLSINLNESKPKFGDVINMTLTITNNGLDDATGVIIENILPSGFIFDKSNITIDKITSGEEILVHVIFKVNTTGNFIISSNIKSREFDSNYSNNNNSFKINIEDNADLSIMGFIGETSLFNHDYVKLTLKVTNNGFNNAQGVFIKINIPYELTYINSTLAYVNDTIYIGNLSLNENKSVEIIYKANEIGDYTIYSNISSDIIDYDLSNNNITNYIKVNPTTDLAISTSVNSTNINYLDYIKVILNVSNIGIDDANHIKIENNISSNLIYINSTSNYDNGVITIDNLKSGKQVSVELIYKVNSTNNYLIITNITADEFDVNLSNNNDTISFNVDTSCDLEIINQINQYNLKYGDLINWTVVIKNNGPDAAHNILIKDLIPNKLSNINLIGDYTLNEGICEIEFLNAGDEIQLNIVGVVDTTGLIESNIEVSAFEFDYNKSNNQNTQIINVESSSDLIVVCIANATNPNYNDLVKFTLTITNAGPDIANNVKIENTLPKGFIYINSTLPNEDRVFNIEKLDNGEIVTIDIITKVNATGNYINTVNITCDNYDSYLDNNNDSTSIYINETSDLSVLVLSNILNDNFINWTVKVKNNGLNIANNIIVNILLPDYLIYVDDDTESSYSSQEGVLNITSLNVSEEFIFNIQTKANKTGLIVNNVSVLGDEYDYNLENNNYTASVNIKEAVDLVISMTTNNTAPNYDDLIKINVEIFNNHTSKATGVEIQKEFSDTLIIINQTQSKGIYNITSWLIDELDVGEVQTLEIICKVNSTTLITSNVSVKANEYDINQSNNFDSLSINASKNYDIELSYSIININPFIGENTILTLIVSNNGLNNYSDVKLITNLDDSLEVIEFNISKGEYSNNTWNIGNISSGSREYLNITFNITKLGLLINNFEVKCLEDDINNISVVINASAFVDVNIEIYVNNTNPSVGDLVKFTINVSNNGFIKANNVVIEKLLPDSLKLINTSLTKGTIDEKSWFECCLERGEVQTLEMICEVLKEGKILYNVNVSSNEFDINLTNNNASILINVSNKTLNNTNVSNLTGKSSIAIKKVTDKVSIIAKKISIVKKSSRVSKIKIILRGKQVILKKNLRFKYLGKNKVNIKLAKSLKGRIVTFKFNSKNYRVKVNKKGYISIKLTKKLYRGKIYTGIASWKAFKVYKNKKLTIKFKNKLYKVKTNKNGVAIFKVTKKMVKNIKKGKILKYIINYQNDKLTRYIKIK